MAAWFPFNLAGFGVRKIGAGTWRAARALYRSSPVTKMILGGALGGGIGAARNAETDQTAITGFMRGAISGVALGGLVGYGPSFFKKTLGETVSLLSARKGVDLGVSVVRGASSLARFAGRNPGALLLGGGIASLALITAPTASNIAAQYKGQQYMASLETSYNTEVDLLETMQQGMVYPSPGTGVSPSLNDRFMNSTSGLVQGLHARRSS